MLIRAGLTALAFCVALAGGPAALAQPSKPKPAPTAPGPAEDEEAPPAENPAAGKKVKTEIEKTKEDKTRDDKTRTRPGPTSDDDEDMPTNSTGPAGGTRGR